MDRQSGFGFRNDQTNISGGLTVDALVPEIVNLENVVVADGQTTCYGALQTIYVAGGITTFTVQSGGSATMIAGQNIVYLPGTTVEAGGYMHGFITTDGQYCSVLPVAKSVATTTEGLAPAAGTILFRLYPNPTTGTFTLEQSGDDPGQNLQLEIYSLLGKRMLLDNIMGEKQHQFNLGNVPNGIYLVKIMTGGKVETIKLVKH